MMELPGWERREFDLSSPQRGPEESHRKSFAIFVRETATVFKAPDVSTAASRAPAPRTGWEPDEREAGLLRQLLE